MRKITLNPNFRYSVMFDPAHHWVVVKDGEQIEELKAIRLEADYKNFTPEQLEVIRTVNYVLKENLHVEMTDEEAEYLIFPFGREQKVKPEDLQKLAGFEVHKEVVYSK